METKRQFRSQGFTLVELLVVITIIGILAALITAAGVGALKRARQAQIKVELDQIAMAFQSAGAFPPNCQIDDTNFTPDGEPAATPLDESQVLTDLKRHLKQAFPRHRERESLLRALAGDSATVGSGTGNVLPGGMSAGEAIVFWLGGFSSDPKYPISGEGGPSYPVVSATAPDNNTFDPIDSRKWVFPFEVARLQPRDATNYFTGNRFIVYPDPQDSSRLRRINFWQYVPAKSEQPYLYFDTSHHPAAVRDSSNNVVAPFDPPAATLLAGTDMALDVHAIKKASESTSAAVPIQFANPDKFQVLHCGTDGEWDDVDSSGELVHFSKMSAAHVLPPDEVGNYLLFPDGPFTGAAADTIVNFSEGTLEASQP